MPRMIFINLPVADLAACTRFYEAIGCVKNQQFSTDQASAMVWSEAITFQLLTHDYFGTFSALPIADAHKALSALYALSADSRGAVDAMVEAATGAGGKADVSPVRDMGFMYVRNFEDLDGNTFETMWLDISAMGAT
ncbi:MAG: Glyoxalase/bleomycin resistance protein/dioxygenase [Brevundimonas sp.]|nr:Glyoxalase/bleomycin resistance protein/dioxygenase [Brevundimonas sp.]